MTSVGSELVSRLDGLLFFPVTPFHRLDDGRAAGVDLDAFASHVASRVDLRDTPIGGPAAVFAACGTGEFWTLRLDEYTDVVRTAVATAAGRVPVIAGVGYGVEIAKGYAAAAEAAGADGLLVLPPYLVNGTQAGLRDHYTAVAAATSLDIIIYQRDNAIFTPESAAELAGVPNIVGFKEGKGDVDLMQRIVSAVRQRHGYDALHFLNGLPTAELSQLAYAGVGVTNYSSAAFCFAPDIAMAFYSAYRNHDAVLTAELIDRFYKPLVELRNQGVGYAVSLVKAGVRLDGLDVGPVRPPLSEARPDHVEQLAGLIADGRRVLVEHGVVVAA
ncbi:5-dehydro-4-deoxyglucarate dehydratase [Catenulispora rubra]|uniref:5-dehydro-4-deoxyglucarate dehydratase n=1 Tax=Catenulispora rubra TaxID=280293 RepID=UPI0018926BCF|nr:5-dehydro-4-deoxyglucarate dehydratase [Catenulispora rubra]